MKNAVTGLLTGVFLSGLGQVWTELGWAIWLYISGVCLLVIVWLHRVTLWHFITGPFRKPMPYYGDMPEVDEVLEDQERIDEIVERQVIALKILKNRKRNAE